MISSSIELAIHRKNTDRFIKADPTNIVLFKKNVSIIDGTERVLPPTARNVQKFKIIWGGESGIIRDVEGGGVRRFDFILVGKYNSVVEIGDYWKNGNQVFTIEYILPSNGYEVKAGGVSHGSKPTG